MLKRALTFSLVLVVALAVATVASDDQDKSNQKVCPISGEGLENKDSYTDYEGKRIFLCCDKCKDMFAKNPESFIEKMKAEGVELMKLDTQSVCPISGEELENKDTYTDYEGERIFFCCPKCIDAFNSDPEKYLKVLSDRGEAPEATPEEEGEAQ